MGMIKRAIGFNAPEKVSKSLFTALVRSDVEYGSSLSLWSGTSKGNLQLIEGIQRRATNYILHYPDIDYRERLSKLKLLPLSFRREIIDLTFFLKCKLELCDLNLNNFVVYNSTLQNRPTTRSSADPLLLIPNVAKLNPTGLRFLIVLCPCGINRLLQLDLLSTWHPSRASSPNGIRTNFGRVSTRIMFALGRHVASVVTVGRCRGFFPLNGGGPLNNILVIGGTVSSRGACTC